MKNSNKKILISGYYGFGNFGDEAILQTLVTKLKSKKNNIKVLSSNPKQTSKLYDVSSCHSFNILKVIYSILRCDIFISGGGSLLQDVTSIKSLLYYLFVLNLAIFARKKVIIFAQGLGPFRNKKGAFFVKNTLKHCSYISVRDKKSHYLLKKWNIQSDLVCDPFFDLPIPNPNPSGIIGIQLRQAKNLNINYIKNLAFTLAKKFPNNKFEIYSFQDAIDLKICKIFKEYLDEKEIESEIIEQSTPLDVIERISKLDYMIAMRFHAVMIAARFGIKTLAISYDMKVEKLAREFNIPYLKMKSSDDFDDACNTMINMDKKKLSEIANTKIFNWDKIESITG